MALGSLGTNSAASSALQDTSRSTFFQQRTIPSLPPGGLAPGTQAKEVLFAQPGSQTAGRLPAAAGLFALYLQSGLEILRESSVRLLCLVEAPRRRGPAALLPEQLARSTGFFDARFYMEALQTQAIELLPLARVSAAGLSAWICLSRDLDSAGVVQREDALRKAMFELCGFLSALDRVWCLTGSLTLSELSIEAIQESRQEVTKSLEQLIFTFKGKGLSLLKLPPEYKRLLANVADQEGWPAVHMLASHTSSTGQSAVPPPLPPPASPPPDT
jgi:hypothetical protein